MKSLVLGIVYWTYLYVFRLGVSPDSLSVLSSSLTGVSRVSPMRHQIFHLSPRHIGKFLELPMSTLLIYQ